MERSAVHAQHRRHHHRGTTIANGKENVGQVKGEAGELAKSRARQGSPQSQIEGKRQQKHTPFPEPQSGARTTPCHVTCLRTCSALPGPARGAGWGGTAGCSRHPA
eukprot:363984-Chlamydomonas_euryale.AAC.16